LLILSSEKEEPCGHDTGRPRYGQARLQGILDMQGIEKFYILCALCVLCGFFCNIQVEGSEKGRNNAKI